jgi:DNA repair protein RadC
MIMTIDSWNAFAHLFDETPQPVPAPAAPAVENTTTVHALPESERPRERLRQLGAGALALRELLAALLHTGTRGCGSATSGDWDVLAVADALIATFGGLPGIAQARLEELQRVRGIGPARAVALKAALELGRRATLAGAEARAQVRNPADAAALIQSALGQVEQEEVWVLCLDTRNRVLGRAIMLYRGQLAEVPMRIAEIFKHAIRLNAAAVIVAHSHPSGDPAPSQNDICVTRELVKASKLLSIDLVDHIIVGSGAGSSYVSLKERRLGFD